MKGILSTAIAIANYLCGMPLLYVAIAVAVILTISTRAFHFRYFAHILRHVVRGGRGRARGTARGISSFSACCTALGNTLGVGNIAGVAIALAAGGPGALFWLWIADMLGLVIKYSEAVLGVRYRETDPETGLYRGGLMWYIEGGMGKRWKWLALVYALIYCSSGVNYPAMQINAVVGAMEGIIPIPPLAIGIVCAILIAFVVLGGIKRLSEMANFLIPPMALLYMVLILVVLLCNASRLPAVLGQVFSCAFSGAAAQGGFAGATASMALRYGIARGFYSNGAGNGDAAFAHAAADVDDPVKQGMWGVTEVLVDTLVCTSTALVILSTGVLDTGLSGAALTTAAFGTLLGERWAAGFVGVITLLFAFTTAVVCTYYGEVCLRYVVRGLAVEKYLVWPYRLLMCGSAILGSVATLESLWGLSDLFLAVCMFICLFVLVRCRKEVAQLTRQYVASLKKTTPAG